MTVEGLKTIFDWVAVILLFLTFASGTAVLITGNIINKRQEKQLRQFDKDLTDAKTALGKQQERAANAESALLELQQRLADRTLTDAQLNEVVESLKPFSGQEFDMTPFWDNKESVSIGNRIVFALEKSGWAFIKPEYQRAILGGLVGIKVIVDPTSGAKTKKAADSLVSTLSRQGLATMKDTEKLTPHNKVQIEVGTKH
jgi:hypothetical protein